jgi:hypothetical protein
MKGFRTKEKATYPIPLVKPRCLERLERGLPTISGQNSVTRGVAQISCRSVALH